MTEEPTAVVQEAKEEIQQVAVEQKPPEQPKQDRNWDEAREVLRLQKQRIEELETRLAQQNQVAQPKQEDADDFAGLDPDDFMTVGKAKELYQKAASKQAKEAAKQVVQEHLQQFNVVQDEQRMRSKHEDFDFVIENYALPMIKNDPVLAYKIQTSKNPAEAAYKLAKFSDEYEASMAKQPQSPKAEKILKNSQRPVSSQAVSSPLKSQADDFSKLSPQQVWEMSQKFARGA